MLTKELCAKRYCISLNEEQLGRILAFDDAQKRLSDELVAMLQAITGVSEVQYDGHFGPFIWLTLEIGYDEPDTWAQIQVLIEKAAK